MSKYLKIANYIQKKIYQHHYPAGSKLPSIASLAKQFDCSKGTIIKAYDVLIAKHIIYTKPQSGYYVGDDFLRHEISSRTYDLSTGNLPVDAFPIIDIKHSMNIAIELYGQYSLSLELRGTPTLSLELIKYLETQGIYTHQNNVFLSQGITQVMSILLSIPFPNDKSIVLIEEPSFSFTVDQLKIFNIPVMTIKRDENGIDMKELEHIFKTYPIKFFYTIPRNHNPLGTYLSHSQRKKIVELAHKYDVYIVENDYLSESYSIPKYTSLYYLSEFKNCIYLKSYTKIFPYIRIGFALIPDELIESYYKGMESAYYTSYYMPDLVSQATLESSLRTNIISSIADSFGEDLKQKGTVYHRVTSHWDRELIDAQTIQSGIYGTIILNSDIDMTNFIEKLNDNGVYVKSNESSYYNRKNYNNSFRISLSRVSPNELKLALQIIYRLAQDLMNA